MKPVILFFIIILTSAYNVFATQQIPEFLIYNEKEYRTFTHPLEYYFDNQHPRPNKALEYLCTAISRGYVGTWKIENNTLNLIKLVKGTCKENPSGIINKIFQKKPTPIKATWFTGTLIVHHGEIIDYVYAHLSTYEKYILITVIDGTVKKILEFDLDEYTKYKKMKFNAYKKTKEYRERVKELRSTGEYEKVDDSFIDGFLIHTDAVYYLSLDYLQQQ